MLTYLENLDFSLLQLQLLDAHVFLLDDFDSDFVLGLDMSGQFDLAELALAKVSLRDEHCLKLPGCHRSLQSVSSQWQP